MGISNLPIKKTKFILVYEQIIPNFAEDTSLSICYMEKQYNRIREVVKSKGIKQTWLADRLGMTFRNLSYMMSNQRQPSIEILYEMSLLLDVEPADLLVPKTQIFNKADHDAMLNGSHYRKQNKSNS